MKPLAHFLKIKIISPFFLFWSLTTLILLLITMSALLNLETERNSLILESTNETLKSPISLGSFVEIKGRLYSINKKYKNYCLDFFSENFSTSNCNEFANQSLINTYQLKNAVPGPLYTLKMYYSRKMFINYSLKYFGLLFLLMIVAGLWFFKRVNIIASKINNEINNIFERTQSEKIFQISEFALIEKNFNEFTKLQHEVVEMEAKSSLARQVSHDIRSPLSALSLILDDLEFISFDRKFLLRSAIDRIQDISNNLLFSNKIKSNESNGTSEMLSSLIEMITSEKRIEYRENLRVNIILDLEQSYGLFSIINRNELKTVISNLINNAIESCSKNEVKIKLKIFSENNFNIIEIIDNGDGIEVSQLAFLGEKIFSNKLGGSGLGIFNARKILTSFKGDLKIASVVNEGTSVFIKLPKIDPPKWFVKELRMDNIENIICIDDDISILEMWRQKFKNDNRLKFYTNFSSVEEISKHNNCFFLVDYEILKNSENGIDFILKNDLTANSILVTSRFEEDAVKFSVEKNDLLMIPKNIIRYVPIGEGRGKVFTDVLIDNDELIHLTWQASASKFNRKLLILKNFSELEIKNYVISPDTNFYVDEELDNGVKGQDIARKLHELGFHKIYITSGHSSEYFSELDFLSGILDKKPPFSK